MQWSPVFYSYPSCDSEIFILVLGTTVIPLQLPVLPLVVLSLEFTCQTSASYPSTLICCLMSFSHTKVDTTSSFVTLWHLCVFVDKVGHTGMMGPPGNGTLVHNPEQYGEGMLWDPDWQAREAHVVLGPEWLWAGQKWLLHIGVLMSMTCLALGKYTCWGSKPPVDGMGILNYMDGVMVDGRTTLPLLAGLLKNVRTCMSLSGRSMTNCLRVGGADGI